MSAVFRGVSGDDSTWIYGGLMREVEHFRVTDGAAVAGRKCGVGLVVA